MPDSPKCTVCGGQTYRIVRTQTFKCQGCKAIFPKQSFEDIEFKWKDEPQNYKTWKDEKNLEKERVEAVKKQAQEQLAKEAKKAKVT